MKSKLKLSRIFFITLIAILILVLIYVGYLAFNNSRIETTPERVLEVFESAGLEISSVLVVNRGDSGPLGSQYQGYQFLLQYEGEYYQIYVEDCEDWKQARAAAKRINDFNDQMRVGFPKASSYGNIGIIYSPDNEEIEELLLIILQQNNHYLQK